MKRDKDDGENSEALERFGPLVGGLLSGEPIASLAGAAYSAFKQHLREDVEKRERELVQAIVRGVSPTQVPELLAVKANEVSFSSAYRLAVLDEDERKAPVYGEVMLSFFLGLCPDAFRRDVLIAVRRTSLEALELLSAVVKASNEAEAFARETAGTFQLERWKRVGPYLRPVGKEALSPASQKRIAAGRELENASLVALERSPVHGELYADKPPIPTELGILVARCAGASLNAPLA